MAGTDDDTDKPHAPTQHKLDEARKKGEVVRSADLTTAAVYAGFLLVALSFGGLLADRVGTALMVLLAQPEQLISGVFEGSSRPVIGGLMATVALGLVAWFTLPACMALMAVFGTRSFVVAPEKLKMKIKRINPISNAKQKYGMSGLFEFAKSFVKLVIYSLVLGIFVSRRLPEMAGALHAEPRGIGLLMVQMLTDFMIAVLPIALAIGGVDYMWQRFDHMRRNRMSHQEIKEEHKQQEGDPHMKQQRRQRAHEIAASQMMAEVPLADVIIVNPTHYAVALKWSRMPGAAPECVAKGVDHIAMAMRDLAIEHGVPIRSDPPTARALYATTHIGDEIQPEHFRVVAAAIRFADAMRRRAKAFG